MTELHAVIQKVQPYYVAITLSTVDTNSDTFHRIQFTHNQPDMQELSACQTRMLAVEVCQNGQQASVPPCNHLKSDCLNPRKSDAPSRELSPHLLAA